MHRSASYRPDPLLKLTALSLFLTPEGQAAFCAHALFLDRALSVSQEHSLTLWLQRKDSVGMGLPSQSPQISATWVPFTAHPQFIIIAVMKSCIVSSNHAPTRRCQECTRSLRTCFPGRATSLSRVTPHPGLSAWATLRTIHTLSLSHTVTQVFWHPQLAHGASKKKKAVWDLCDNLTLNMLAYVDNLRYKTGVFKLDPGSHKGLKVVFVLWESK